MAGWRFFNLKLNVKHNGHLSYKVFYVKSLAHSHLIEDNLNFMVNLENILENSF